MTASAPPSAAPSVVSDTSGLPWQPLGRGSGITGMIAPGGLQARPAAGLGTKDIAASSIGEDTIDVETESIVSGQHSSISSLSQSGTHVLIVGQGLPQVHW